MREELIKEFGDTNSVDYIGLTEGIMEITRYSEMILGFLVVLLFSLMTFVVSLELVYINLPIFRNKMDLVLSRERKVVGLILHDAVIAVERANTVETGKSANKIYLSLKTKHIVIAVVILNIVLLGWGPIIGIVVKVAKGVIDAIGGII